MRARRLVSTVVVLAVAAAIATGCAAASGSASTPSPTASESPKLEGTLTVFAAASLTGTFDALADEFEKANPKVDVVVNYGGSSGLAEQIVTGAPADVFAAASDATMKTVVDAGLAADPTVFATNVLELAVPPGNPGKVTGLADLANPGLTVALCDVAVPCGAAAQKLLTAVGVTAAPDTLEQDVKAVLTKVSLGEAQAGLVYVTDVKAAGKGVDGIVIPEASKASTNYPIAAISDSKVPELASAWIALVTGKKGQAELADAGFGAP